MSLARYVLDRRSAVRVGVHGLELATKNETDISLIDLEDWAANVPSSAHGVLLELRSGPF